MRPLLHLPDEAALAQVFALKYEQVAELGWSPRLRREHGYHTPDDWYEAAVAALVVPGLRWLDIGCGRELLPNNPALARILADRCSRLVGVDPDPTLQENPYVHEKVSATIDDYDGRGAFDLVTLRMVAEHIEDPERCVRAVQRALAPGGLAVVYTVCAASPIPLLTRLCPMPVRHRIKSFLWGTLPKDTFPTRFRMNTRSRLARLFAGVGMSEAAFLRLDDCRTFARFAWLCEMELRLRKVFAACSLPYPEHNLLGYYRAP
jgi:SAM-dependent methyltransferase